MWDPKEELNNVFYSSHGVDADYFRSGQEEKHPNSLIVTGNTGYPPNVDAVLYFHAEVWPRILRTVPSTHWYIVGSRPLARSGVWQETELLLPVGYRICVPI